MFSKYVSSKFLLSKYFSRYKNILLQHFSNDILENQMQSNCLLIIHAVKSLGVIPGTTT